MNESKDRIYRMSMEELKQLKNEANMRMKNTVDTMAKDAMESERLRFERAKIEFRRESQSSTRTTAALCAGICLVVYVLSLI